MEILAIYDYYKERITEIKRFANSGPGDLWAFVIPMPKKEEKPKDKLKKQGQ